MKKRPAASTQPVPGDLGHTDAVDSSTPRNLGGREIIEAHRVAAEALAREEVIPLRADAHLAHYNARRGCDAVLAARAAIEATGFRADWEAIEALASLSLAVAFAHDRSAANPKKTGAVLALLREARPLRALLLLNARTASLGGMAPPMEVARIGRGSGPFDATNDLVDLALLHTAHGLAGVGAVSVAQVKRAHDLGCELRVRLRPKGARATSRRSEEQLAAMALRDRLWTLLVRSYRDVERAAGALWGASAREHVPALQSRHVPRKRAAKSDAAPS